MGLRYIRFLSSLFYLTLHFCSVTNSLAVCLPLFPVCLFPFPSQKLVSPSVYLSLIGVYTHTHSDLQALGHKRRSVWKMKLFYVNRLLSLRRLHITSVTTNLSLSLSLSLFPSHFLAHLLSHLFHHSFSSVTLPLVSPSPQILPLSSSAPLFFVIFCRLSPPLRRGEWISKLIPDSCSGWWATLRIRIGNSASDLGSLLSILVFRKR